MKVSGVTVWLPSNNLKETLELYVECFHFEKLFDFDAYCMVQLGEHCLAFYPSTSKLELDIKRPQIVSFEITEIQQFYDNICKVSENHFTHKLELMQPGVWQFEVIDNNGYKMGFSQSAHD